MEIINEFLLQHSNAVYFVLGVIATLFIWWLVPAKKPKSRGTIYVLHYPNEFKELYLKLEDDIEKFENDAQVCFDVDIEDRTK